MTRSSGLIVALALLLGGCAFTTMDPAHRLEAGEVVAQGALDEPGFLYIPRLSGAVTYGAGGTGDIGVHVGTTLANFNGGASMRLYVAERWFLGVQGDILVTTFESDLFTAGSRFVITSVTPRFGRLLVDEDEHFYGGFQLQGLLPITVENDTDVNLTNDPGFAAGGYLGFAFDSPGDWDFQIELSGSPVGLFRLSGPDEEDYQITPTPIVQLGFGIQYRKEDDRPAPPRPTEETDDGRIR